LGPSERLRAHMHARVCTPLIARVCRQTRGLSEERGRLHQTTGHKHLYCCCATPTTRVFGSEQHRSTQSSRSIPTRSMRQRKVTSGRLLHTPQEPPTCKTITQSRRWYETRKDVTRDRRTGKRWRPRETGELPMEERERECC
jgi:hypothetical protein